MPLTILFYKMKERDNYDRKPFYKLTIDGQSLNDTFATLRAQIYRREALKVIHEETSPSNAFSQITREHFFVNTDVFIVVNGDKFLYLENSQVLSRLPLTQTDDVEIFTSPYHVGRHNNFACPDLNRDAQKEWEYIFGMLQARVREASASSAIAHVGYYSAAVPATRREEEIETRDAWVSLAEEEKTPKTNQTRQRKLLSLLFPQGSSGSVEDKGDKSNPSPLARLCCCLRR